MTCKSTLAESSRKRSSWWKDGIFIQMVTGSIVGQATPAQLLSSHKARTLGNAIAKAGCGEMKDKTTPRWKPADSCPALRKSPKKLIHLGISLRLLRPCGC